MAESHQKKLKRVRAPKVKIEYEVDTGDAIEKRELPFVTGVIADLNGGQPVKDANGKPVRIDKRKFVDIDRDNFNDVLRSSGAKASFQVDDRLSGEEGKKLNVSLDFESLDDFHPEQVAQQIPALKELVEARRKLAALKAATDGNPDLADTLNDILGDAEKAAQIKDAFSGEGAEGGADEEPDGGGEEPSPSEPEDESAS